MSKLDYIFSMYTNMLKDYPGEKITSGEAQDKIKALMLELIGEDEEYYGGTAAANSINDRIIHRRNRLRKELREKIEAL